MCGIAGFVNDDPIDVKCPVLKRMTDIIAHRGPDDEGKYVDEHVAMGHRRLSIIDLEGGKQPILNEDGSMIITFNGEIYNYQPLREELIKAGHTFTTNGDTEVLLHGYEEWGPKLLDRLRGMFAFVIWDKNKQEMFGARDQFGIKPFYYAQMNGTFMYASEIKALLQHPDFVKEFNPDPLRAYLTVQYNCTNQSFFKGVFQLPPAHWFIYREGKMETHQYWDPRQRESRQSLKETVDAIDKAVMESVEAHKIADVEVGSFLSAGVDSSYVASVARPDHTYSVGFGTGPFNEAKQAKELSEMIKLNNESKIVSPDEAFTYFRRIQWHLDEPDGNPSCVPLFFLSQLAGSQVHVVMSGEGADELFAGYQPYGFYTKSKIIRFVTQMLEKLPRRARTSLAHFIWNRKDFHGKLHMYLHLAPPEECFYGCSRVMTEDEADHLLNPEFHKGTSQWDPVLKLYKSPTIQNVSDIKKKQYVDMHQGMVKDILLKADKMSMANSLELRVPILDREVMKVAETVPTKYLINWHNSKYAFREAAARHLPEEWYNREKMGFPVPIKNWLREEPYYRLVRSVFEQDYVTKFFDRDALLKMIDDNYANKNNARRKIWTVYSFLVWYDIFFNHNGEKPDLTPVSK
ncbi:asparagine synthase (glutamine-hydrolyzing) [Bifidobacterium sp. 64T4]|uniref:asparagine synthase (glutamine-hydrolyzing) n=1 Tax=Bifidobacterium pongonis TaxID=2834432 RepID=UPI001C588075|nr:asparagine synthase (glutamine-hydrolyzing) [Bifidobacterium pongonis]MBW3094158.1 asparagine synthase (glutamine-hydrolyzing) [Bifidobacterium pongonis]